MTSDEMLKSMNESPDALIEYTIPDTGKQSLDASGVINVGDQRFVSDRDSDGDIGLIGDKNNQEKVELSGDELIEYFQKVTEEPQQTQQPKQQQPAQQGSSNQNQGQQSKPSGEQSQKPSGSTQTQQPSQPSGGGFDYYDGYGSYNAMIDAYCKFYPELSREEVIKRNPDLSTLGIDEASAIASREEGRLHGG